MTLEKHYQPAQREPALRDRWQAHATYAFDPQGAGTIYSIDTPPPTVSGKLHLGHVYSYSHADFMARFMRMNGYNVFYPMGFDDNGLPTERLVEQRDGISAAKVGREAFIARCLEASEEAEQEYRSLWERLGLSIDWRYTYRTIDDNAQRCSQTSFIDLYNKGLAYRAQAPVIWCPECRTAIAQADLEDRPRESEFITLPFAGLEGAPDLRIATTRPELLAACAAVFVHPDDPRYKDRIGRSVSVPLYGRAVPVLADIAAQPETGTGAVMCCTFGDQTDVAWWRTHNLPLYEIIGPDGRMLPAADLPQGESLRGLTVQEARARIKAILAQNGLLLDRQPVHGMVRVHERCDTPVEYRVTPQWFIKILENRETFLELGAALRWHPEPMHARYRAWVENLNWDWCISRQRTYGVHFPLWYCMDCGAVQLAELAALPVNPLESAPAQPCDCGSTRFEPERDIMDTWATSSLSPQIVTGWRSDPRRFDTLFPLTLRPQAHEIIRTWAFYSIVKAWYHFGKLPWSDVFISGWGIAGEGMGKISKSKGGGPAAPMTIIERYSADAARYWAASTAPGKDAQISEEKIEMGARLVTKLWNVARFAEPFLADASQPAPGSLTPADRWLLAGLDALVERVTAAFRHYEYAQAKAETEAFFWQALADNYIEMAKLRLYDPRHPHHAGACFTLNTALAALLKLFAPILPFVTEEIWLALYAERTGCASIHHAQWPAPLRIAEPGDLAAGEALLALATAARRYKSERSLSLGSPLARLQIAAVEEGLAALLAQASADLRSVTRAERVEITQTLQAGLERLPVEFPGLAAAVERGTAA